VFPNATGNVRRLSYVVMAVRCVHPNPSVTPRRIERATKPSYCPGGPRLLLCLAAAVFWPNVHAQVFQIDQIHVLTDGRVELTYPADAQAYYRLIAGPSVEQIHDVLELSVGSQLRTREPGSTSAFFRVQSVPRTASLDSDQDGLPDLFELLRPRFDALDAVDGQEDFDGDGRNSRSARPASRQ